MSEKKVKVKFSKIGRAKYLASKRILGIDILELIFGKDFWTWAEEETDSEDRAATDIELNLLSKKG